MVISYIFNYNEVLVNITAGRRQEQEMLKNYRKSKAAMITEEDLKLLEALEDKIDVLLAKEALAGQKDEDLVPWDEIKARHGLKQPKRLFVLRTEERCI